MYIIVPDRGKQEAGVGEYSLCGGISGGAGRGLSGESVSEAQRGALGDTGNGKAGGQGNGRRGFGGFIPDL